jgi:hypothetical protein
MEGILSVKTDVLFKTGSSLKGRVLTQTACNLQQASITDAETEPTPTSPPTAAPTSEATGPQLTCGTPVRGPILCFKSVLSDALTGASKRTASIGQLLWDGSADVVVDSCLGAENKMCQLTRAKQNSNMEKSNYSSLSLFISVVPLRNIFNILVVLLRLADAPIFLSTSMMIFLAFPMPLPL